MSLLRIFGIGGKKKQADGGYDEPPDGLAVAREEMMGRMRARMEPAPAEPAPPETVDPSPDAFVASNAPPPAESAAAAPIPAAESDPLAGMAAIGDETSGAGDELMDLFRDAKEEVDEGSLASEVEDVSISDLLGDVLGVSSRLGVKPATREETPAVPEPADQLDLTSVLEEEPAFEEPPLTVTPPANLRQVQFDQEEGALEEAAEPELSAAGSHGEEYADPPHGPRGAGQRYIMHVLFLGLALTMGVGLGIRSAQSGALVADTEATPAVLAYLNPPIVPPDPEPVENGGEDQKSLQKDARAATPSPSPSPSPSPTPTPQTRSYPFIPGQPAWMIYAIQSGDSLSSIAEAFEVCPDYILWNNPDRKEEDRLIVGDEMLLPGYRGIVYRMQEGETLNQVAARYSTTADMVLAYPGNRLKSADDAKKGTVLLLPDAIPPSALLQDAEAQWAYTNPSADGYIWPFYGPITTFYGEERPGYVHSAIDIGGLGHFGAPVLAVAEGRVDKVESLYHGLGRYVVISHEDGSRSVYGHMSDVYVKAGDYVSQGQPVGALGCTGHSTGTHLHFELWINGGPVDPLAYLP